MAVINPDFDQQRLLVHYLLSNYGLLTLHVPCFGAGIYSQVHRTFVERKLHKKYSTKEGHFTPSIMADQTVNTAV